MGGKHIATKLIATVPNNRIDHNPSNPHFDRQRTRLIVDGFLIEVVVLVSLIRMQVLTEEIIHAVPGIVQHVRPVEIVKFTRIHPKRK